MSLVFSFPFKKIRQTLPAEGIMLILAAKIEIKPQPSPVKMVELFRNRFLGQAGVEAQTYLARNIDHGEIRL